MRIRQTVKSWTTRLFEKLRRIYWEWRVIGELNINWERDHEEQRQLWLDNYRGNNEKANQRRGN